MHMMQQSRESPKDSSRVTIQHPHGLPNWKEITQSEATRMRCDTVKFLDVI